MNFAVDLGIINNKVLPSFYKYTILIALLLLISGCVGTRYLGEDQKLLYKQTIENVQHVQEDDLEDLYVQEANKQLPLLPFSPYVWFYQIGLKKYDPLAYRREIEEVRSRYDEKIRETENSRKARKYQKKKINKIQKLEDKIEQGNVWMRWGEPLAIYNRNNVIETTEKMKLYLQSKGYFKGEVKFREKTIGKKRMKISYLIEENEPYIIDTVFSKIFDPVVDSIYSENAEESLIQKSDNYDQGILIRERERITSLLRNNGYYGFSKQFIDFDVDTAFNDSGNVAIRTTIKNPPGNITHKRYKVDSVNFLINSNLSYSTDTVLDAEYYRGINYRLINFPLNKKILSRRVFIRKDSVYSRQATLNTQRQLANLDNFKFINVAFDSTGNEFVANIFASPLSRYQWSNEFGVNVTQGFPGPFYNLSFKKRNIFGGLENFDITARIGIEGVAPATRVDQDFYRSTEAGINASLTFPQFILPIGSNLKERLGQVNPKTRLSGGYAYTNRPEYIRENINFNMTYSWENGRNIQYSFTAADLNLINSALDSVFRQRLVTVNATLGNNLINSFNPSFVSSMRFQVNLNKNDYGVTSNNSSFTRLYLESGGTTLNFINTSIFDENEETGRDRLEYFKFLKVAGDYRKVVPVNSKSTLAYRLNVGIALPYSENEILPYEKYFFAGGSNGIRAWRPRRLGPGSYTQLDTTGVSPRVSYAFEQPGEILLEGSLEWRQKLIGFIDYAWFVDFGNTWTLREDASRVGANFELDRFWREIAIGSGLGLRFDFSFLILRFDAGVKIYDPARPLGSRFIFSNGHFNGPFRESASETVVLNIGIGYPF